MLSPREIFRLTCRFSPSAVSRSALMVHSFSPTCTQLSGSPISSASAELPASTSPIDRISVLLPTPLSPSSSVHFRVTPEAVSSGSVSDRIQRTLVSSTFVRNMAGIYTRTNDLFDPNSKIPRIGDGRCIDPRCGHGLMHLEHYAPGARRQLTLSHDGAAA